MAIYHVATDGSGDFTTIAQVNAATFVAGDSVLFRRGDSWRERIIPVNNIIYADYGTGNKPIIYGSVNKTNILYWTDEGSNIWSTDVTTECGNIIFNNETIFGDWKNLQNDTIVAVTNFAGSAIVETSNDFMLYTGNKIIISGTGGLYDGEQEVIGWSPKYFKIKNVAFSGNTTGDITYLYNQGDYYCNQDTKKVYLYSTSNPALFYSNIELAIRDDISAGLSNKSNITFRNLAFKYHGTNQMWYGSYHKNITIDGCEEYYAGGCRLWGKASSRGGGGISAWENAENYRVENNYIKQCYDGALSFEYAGAGGKFKNITFKNNIVEGADFGFTSASTDVETTMENINIFHNDFIVKDNWSKNQRDNNNPSSGGTALKFWSSFNATISNYNIKNNIVYGADKYFLEKLTSLETGIINIDYNDYYGSATFSWGGVDYNLNDYQTATSQDSHSISSDPLLTADYHLKSGSPCINAGVEVGVNTDYSGKSRVGSSDIGAYEFRQGLETKGVKRSGVIFK
jgi:hypothetical protein